MITTSMARKLRHSANQRRPGDVERRPPGAAARFDGRHEEPLRAGRVHGDPREPETEIEEDHRPHEDTGQKEKVTDGPREHEQGDGHREGRSPGERRLSGEGAQGAPAEGLTGEDLARAGEEEEARAGEESAANRVGDQAHELAPPEEAQQRHDDPGGYRAQPQHEDDGVGHLLTGYAGLDEGMGQARRHDGEDGAGIGVGAGDGERKGALHRHHEGDEGGGDERGAEAPGEKGLEGGAAEDEDGVADGIAEGDERRDASRGHVRGELEEPSA